MLCGLCGGQLSFSIRYISVAKNIVETTLSFVWRHKLIERFGPNSRIREGGIKLFKIRPESGRLFFVAALF